jgi:hypothetical protein
VKQQQHKFTNEDLICTNPKHFNAIKDYIDLIFTKKLPSQERSAYFNNVEISDKEKKETAQKEITRQEWCDLKRRFLYFIEEKVAVDGVHVCDKPLVEIHQEIALYFHRYIFQAKAHLVYFDETQNSEILKVNIPTAAWISHEVKDQAIKNGSNSVYYKTAKEKKKNKKVKKSSNNKSSKPSGEEFNDGEEANEENQKNGANNGDDISINSDEETS